MAGKGEGPHARNSEVSFTPPPGGIDLSPFIRELPPIEFGAFEEIAQFVGTRRMGSITLSGRWDTGRADEYQRTVTGNNVCRGVGYVTTDGGLVITYDPSVAETNSIVAGLMAMKPGDVITISVPRA